MKKILNISVRNAMLAAFVLIILTVISTGLLEHRLMVKARSGTEYLASVAQRLQEGAGEMKYIVVNTQRIATNSILAEDENMLVLAPVQSNRFYALVDEMSNLVGEDEEDVRKRLENLKISYRNFLTKVLSMSAQFVEGIETSVDKLAEVNLSAQLFIDELNELTGQISHISKQNVKEIHGYHRTSFYVELFSFGAILLVIIAALFFMERKLSRPLSTLMSFVRGLTGKEDGLSRRIAIKRRDEIGELGTSLNTMLNSLEKTSVSRNLLMEEVAERKRAEGALQKAHDKLEMRVEERTAELVEANENLKHEIEERKRAEEQRMNLETRLQQAEKMEVIGTLAGGVAHDLNNILSGLTGYPDLMKLTFQELGIKDDTLTESVEAIKKSGLRASAVVNDLLTLARRGVSVREVVNLNDIISEYLLSPEHEKLLAYHQGVQIITNLNASLNILGSSIHLSKTVMNLVSNAAEAMPGGGQLSILTENEYVDRPIRGYDRVEQGEYVVLTVSDSGVGIAPEDINKIFEPFYTKKKLGRSGTGLGMAVVWGTVQDHNGYITVRSKEEDTTITLYFPVTREELVKERQLSLDDYMGNGEAILVVDDIKEQRELGEILLSRLGYYVTTVNSGEEAVEYLRDNSVDLLVLDMIMDPGIDGCETYKRICELHPNQKAIISSGFSETDRVKEAQELGAGLYVKKPYTLEKIGMAVKEELSN